MEFTAPSVETLAGALADADGHYGALAVDPADGEVLGLPAPDAAPDKWHGLKVLLEPGDLGQVMREAAEREAGYDDEIAEPSWSTYLSVAVGLLNNWSERLAEALGEEG